MTMFLTYVIKDQPILTAYRELVELQASLNDMGLPIDNTTALSKIVSALPDDKFYAFKKSWDSVPDNAQTMANLHARLQEEDQEMKHKEMAREESSEAHAKSVAYWSNQNQKNPKFNGQKKGFEKKPNSFISKKKKASSCFNCEKMRHWSRECLRETGTTKTGATPTGRIEIKTETMITRMEEEEDASH
jgi:hypothetical protein